MEKWADRFMQMAIFLLAVAAWGQQADRGSLVPDRTQIRDLSPSLRRHSDRWLKNAQEAGAAARQWAYNQSLRVLPPKYRDVSSWRESPPQIRRLLRLSAQCAAALAQQAKRQVMQAYQLSPADFSIIEFHPAIEEMPPSKAPTRFDPQKIHVPYGIRSLLTYPEPNPPEPIPSPDEVQMLTGRQRFPRARRGLTREEKAAVQVEREASTQDKIRQMEESKKRQATAERQVDQSQKPTAPPAERTDQGSGPVQPSPSPEVPPGNRPG